MAEPTKKELLAQAEELGLDVNDKMTNKQIQAAIDENQPARLEEEGSDSESPSTMTTTENVEETDGEPTDEDFKNATPVDDEEEEEEKPTRVKSAPKKVEPLSDGSTERVARTREMDVKRRLAKEPKVRMFIPLGIGEKKNALAYIPVTINGYRTEIPKGQYVEVPQSIADILAESQQQTVDAGNEWKIDLDPEKEKQLR